MSQAKDEADYLRRPFWFAHLIWAVVGLAASTFLIVYGGEGHPPGIILLPVVWILWALGHGGNDQKHLNGAVNQGQFGAKILNGLVERFVCPSAPEEAESRAESRPRRRWRQSSQVFIRLI